MTTFNWQITNLEYNIEDGGVVVAHWKCTGTHGETTASKEGTVEFNPDSSNDSFIPYEALTEEMVLEWVNVYVPVGFTESFIQEKIDDIINPVAASGLPWVS